MGFYNMERKRKNFKTDKNRVDKFEPQIKRICGEVFMSTANFEVDTKEATDMLTMDLQPIRLACRVREYRYYHEYKDQFTIRAWRYSGVETELQKFMSGHCDYMFYGFSDPYDKRVISYFRVQV